MTTFQGMTAGTVIPPGTLLRVVVSQASAEVLLSPALLLNLQSWTERFREWATLLAENGSGVVPVSQPVTGGDPRLSTQTLVVDVRTVTVLGSQSAETIAARVSKSMPLGADLKTLTLLGTNPGSRQSDADREALARKEGEFLPSLLPDALQPSRTVLVLGGLVLVALAVFLLGRGARDLRDVVR